MACKKYQFSGCIICKEKQIFAIILCFTTLQDSVLKVYHNETQAVSAKPKMYLIIFFSLGIIKEVRPSFWYSDIIMTVKWHGKIRVTKNFTRSYITTFYLWFYEGQTFLCTSKCPRHDKCNRYHVWIETVKMILWAQYYDHRVAMWGNRKNGLYTKPCPTT